MGRTAIKTAAITIAASLMLAGCGGINQSATLVNIDKGKDTITLGYGNFVARYTQATYDSMYRGYFGDDYWTQDIYGDGKKMQASVKKEVMDGMEEKYLAKKYAKDYKVELTKDQEKSIAKAAKKFMKDNDEDAIEQMGATEDYAKTMMEYETYGTEVKNKIREEAKVSVKKEDYEEATISYVTFPMVSSDENAGEEQDKETKAKSAESAKAVAAAKDFDAEVQAQGGTVQTASYVIKGKSADEDLDEKVIDEAKKLKKGKVSGVIEVEEDGYYVIRKDKDLDADASKNKKTELEDEQRDDHYEKILKGWKKKIDWDVDKEAWKKVTFKELFEAPKEESSESAQ